MSNRLLALALVSLALCVLALGSFAAGFGCLLSGRTTYGVLCYLAGYLLAFVAQDLARAVRAERR